MKLQHIYSNDINRNINGVIKVAQDDETAIKQELEEYIITNELGKHFKTFLGNYERSIKEPTDKIGVWISGFFGSGKSHFLKMLSYLLSNRVVAGKTAVSYFSDKFVKKDDEEDMYEKLERCVQVPTETILFNIDSKSPLTKDKTAILRIFAKVFYEHMGFYGNDLKVAKLEQFISKTGKAEAFRDSFQRINGGTWEESRDSFAFFEDDIVEAMTETLDMSETAARNWFNGEEEIELSIEQLVKEIKEYIDSREDNFRLLFMIDEVGQYIGSDSDLMLNLQTIVEEIGSKCGGRCWVMVTSQEAIDSITKISGDDFYKIQGRFNTRLSLSSSSVDEVIKKRILAKTVDAEQMLKMQYEKNHAVLRNLFTFTNAVLDMKGYSSEEEFISTYPFVPYQFRLMQNVLAQIRKHGNSGKHLSGGERSMLSGFQEAAQAIQNKDENALVPFYLFYDTVHTFLESSIRRVIDRCQTAADNHDGIMQEDVSILKLLYLVRYVDDVNANIDNISVLMADQIGTDKINTRHDIQQSLDRLISQNYVSRSGDTYTFLTDDEQDIAREIKNTPVDSADVTKAVSEVIFGSLYTSKKFKYGKYDFAFDRKTDETYFGQLSSSICLHFITAASDDYSSGDSGFLMRSSAENEVIIVLAESSPYFKEIETAKQIRKYVMSKNVARLPESIQKIISSRQTQASEHEKRAEELIARAIAEGRIYVAGDKIEKTMQNAVGRIDYAMQVLIESVYTKLNYIRKNYDSDADILEILNTKEKQIAVSGTESPNSEAVREVMQYLEIQKIKHLPTSMGDIQKRYSTIPYGWREIDIAAVIAELIADQKIYIKYAGNAVQTSDKKLLDYLRRRTEIDKALVEFRVAPPTALIKQTREFLGEYFNCGIGSIPDDEDSLITYIIDSFNAERDYLKNLLETEYSKEGYPGKAIIENGIKLCNEQLMKKSDNIALLKKSVEMRDDMLDQSEDMADVKTFFRVQREIFDSAAALTKNAQEEWDYFRVDNNAKIALTKIKDILLMQKPYKNISQLPDLCRVLREIYEKALNEKREEVIADIQAVMGEIHREADVKQDDIVQEADKALQEKISAANNCAKLTSLDAMKIQLSNIRQQYLKKLIVVPEADGESTIKAVTVSRNTICTTMKIQSEEDIDKYVAQIKEKLMEKLSGNDILHII